ncbi:MAG: tyrosine-type recombinase/integrase [Frankiales bacterium]|nr:tyrosine-type recombinase/integrase [Frankiales bacterium]
MGFTRKRKDTKGGVRYAAVYRDARGQVRQAGTFATRKEANLAWQRAEARLAAGRPDDASAGKLRFEDYVNERWFPHHVLEPSTRQSYRYVLDRHIVPWFGPMRMRDILPAHVRQWVTEMDASGVSPASIRHVKIVLSAIFTTALNDFVIAIHPCRGVKSPTVPVKEYRILTPEEYARLYDALPNDASRLIVEVAIGSGLRWGELTELRVRDIHPVTGILTVTRSVVELSPKFHPTGERFLVKPYPKTKHSRRLKLDQALVAEIQRHTKAHGLRADDLLFQLEHLSLEAPSRPLLVDAAELGLTEPNAAGRTYRHGTLSAYTAGKCRCAHCKAAFASYRAQRRAEGRDEPRGSRAVDTDGHLPRDWFTRRVWRPACTEAGLDPRPRLHDLRHSHASWLLAGGADLQVVRDRLGHTSIATTSKYVHTLPTADETALAALRRVKA